MKLAISNIAWADKDNNEVYKLMQNYDFSGLEIAPTKIIPNNPYSHIVHMIDWVASLYKQYGFCIPSMQSIWYGRKEKIFSTKTEREILIDYTKSAIDFASAIDCKNIVFGCPKNRNINDDKDYEIAIDFFKELGEYAFLKNTCIGMEANPTIYGTNFINDTKSAIDLIKQVNSKGFKLNLDIGTMIQNEEDSNELTGNVELINHVHISEPYLENIKIRNLHKEIIKILKQRNYNKFISIEVKQQDNIANIEHMFRGIKEIL